jgi:hypothetical protein
MATSLRKPRWRAYESATWKPSTVIHTPIIAVEIWDGKGLSALLSVSALTKPVLKILLLNK